MTDADSVRFKNVMAELGVTFSKTITSPLTTQYWKLLKDIPIDLFETACERVCKQGTTFPRPASIRNAVDELQDERRSKQKLLPGKVETGGQEHCAQCHDSGMVNDQHCGENGFVCKACKEGRPCPGPRYHWAYQCPCRTNNPVIQARRRAVQRYGSKPKQEGYKPHRRDD